MMNAFEIRETSEAVRNVIRRQLPRQLARSLLLVCAGALIAAALMVGLSQVHMSEPALRQARALVLAAFLGFPLALLLVWLLYLTVWWFFPRRWIFTEDRLRARSFDRFGKIRWSRFASWVLRPIPELPGYDFLVLQTRSHWYRHSERLELLLEPSVDRAPVVERLRSRIRAA